MKSILAVAALLAGLAAPALAEEAATPQPAPQAAAPAAEQILPAALPQSEPASGETMSLPAEAAVPVGDGGCHHAKSTVYLTN